MSYLLSIVNRTLDRTLDGGATYTLALAPELLAFQGHFPGDPILPGVVQIDWAVHFGAEAFGPLGTFRGMEHIKFMQILRPGDRVDLHLTFNPEAGKLVFTFASAEGKKSSGVVLFSRT
jgi:3-hydroxymyristoyl/3-hydroxydecanoyl-(acyl carrier protein) dehydratase